ncbi:phosphatidylserine synthase [Proteus mirabilis]|uniref:Phosphatidylserine synthase n=1 Tax=Proteus mirabilis TaxID=584 RepID=A0A2X2BK97_PROMI|nr:phosphatidylserine synthase [Proteus mirabilis]
MRLIFVNSPNVFNVFIDNDQLTVRLWKDGDNTYHLKGMWVDDEWQLITGNNLNPRAWGLDLENAILIHDPHHELHETTP